MPDTNASETKPIMKKGHTFHIPVMGTGFSIDTPLKVARYGISSVISLVDDILIEQMREHYCKLNGEPYAAITNDDEDHRARRITEYLNLLDLLVKKQIAELKASSFELGSEITKYFELLPDSSLLKKLYLRMLKTTDPTQKAKLQQELRDNVVAGDINVNIMTKLDKTNYDKDDNPLTEEFSDALAALRGYAKSTLNSAIVFSAGLNRRLYSYVENFRDFYADAKGFIQKKIVLKVSDYRSAIIQGKFFAKKGLWISEYRIESGLNCGGHVFPAAGELMGPIMEEFKTRKQEFIAALHEIYNQALKIKNLMPFVHPHSVCITAQGGIGTAKEDKFLRDYYGLDSTGWGSPFLLVPEVTNVDEKTLQKLTAATEDDYYISDVSPLGVPFNNIRDSESDLEQIRRTEKGRPGSSCPKGFLVSSTEFTKKAICRASRLYQKLKIDHIGRLNLDPTAYQKAYRDVVKKSCVCNDLGEPAILKNKLFKNGRAIFTAICPGPNLAYFSKVFTLKEMVDHIYGRANILKPIYRPHMFIKELTLNIGFLKAEIEKAIPQPTPLQTQYFNEFRTNLFEGIEYYRKLIPQMLNEAQEFRQKILAELNANKKELENLISSFPGIFPVNSTENTLQLNLVS